VTDGEFRSYIVRMYGEEGLQHLHDLDLYERYKDLWKREIEHQQKMDNMWTQHQKHMRKMASRWQWFHLIAGVSFTMFAGIVLVYGGWLPTIPAAVGTGIQYYFYRETGRQAVRYNGKAHPWQRGELNE
jgi:hypothetical protein